MIKTVKETGYKRTVIFAPDAAPLGQEATLLTPRMDKIESADFWEQIVDGSSSKFYAAGISLSYWSSNRYIMGALKRAAERGCSVKIMTMHENNPVNISVFNPKVTRGKNWKGDLKLARDRFKNELAGYQCVEVRGIKNGSIHQQIVINEEKCWMIPFLYSAETDQGPLITCSNDFPLYETLNGEFDTVWHLNTWDRENSSE